MSKRTYGFTIVELLIVIVVIGILAAISIVAYNNISNKANDSAVQSDLANIGKKFEMYRVAEEVWPVTLAEISLAGIKATKSAYGDHLVSGLDFNLLYCRHTSGEGDIALIGSSKSGKRFFYTGGTVAEYTGGWNGTGTADICASAGVPIPDLTHRIWLYEANVWRSFL